MLVLSTSAAVARCSLAGSERGTLLLGDFLRSRDTCCMVSRMRPRT